MELDSFESVNINDLWLKNIFENLKNLEQMERIAREGCINLFDYLQIPYNNRALLLGDAQYKNMKFMMTELHLLLTDLTPAIDKEKLKEFRKRLDKLIFVSNKKEFFIEESYNASENRVTNVSVTPFFWEAINYLSTIKTEVIQEISHILYIKSQNKIGFNR